MARKRRPLPGLTPRREARPDEKTPWWGYLLVLSAIALLVGAGLLLWETPWMGRGVAYFLPTQRAQVVAGVVLMGILLATTLGSMLRPAGAPISSAVASVGFFAGELAFLLAPLSRTRAPDGIVQSADALRLTIYGGYAVVALLCWLVPRGHRRRRAAWEHAHPVASGAPSHIWMGVTAFVLPFAVVLSLIVVGLTR